VIFVIAMEVVTVVIVVLVVVVVLVVGGLVVSFVGFAGFVGLNFVGSLVGYPLDLMVLKFDAEQNLRTPFLSVFGRLSLLWPVLLMMMMTTVLNLTA